MHGKGCGTDESANLVKARGGVRSRKNDLKSFHSGRAALLDKGKCG
jgi:hypothetical protein